MAVSVSVSGVSGRLKVGYKEAARLGAWRLSLAPRLPRQYDITAEVEHASELWMAHRPLTLVLDIGNSSWEWADVHPLISGKSMTFNAMGMPTIVTWAKQRGG